MPFGLTNPSEKFQRVVYIALSNSKWKTSLIYLDDVMISSNDVKSHNHHVEEILTALGTAEVTLKLESAHFFWHGIIPWAHRQVRTVEI